MPRQPGSGMAAPEANACAVLLAAQFGRSQGVRVLAADGFAEAYEARAARGGGGGRGLEPGVLSELMRRVPKAMGLVGARAEACGPGQAGDVLVTGPDQIVHRIEIKAQLTLANFDTIQAADWVRDQTDFLGEIVRTNAGLRAQLSNELLGRIEAAYKPQKGWNLASLWAADLAGMTNRATRECLDVNRPSDLLGFLQRKYVVHITRAGLRLFRMSDIPNLTSGLAGNLTAVVMPWAQGSEARVRTNGDGTVPVVGNIQFTYHVGQNNRPVGGHHVHERFFNGATPMLTVATEGR